MSRAFYVVRHPGRTAFPLRAWRAQERRIVGVSLAENVSQNIMSQHNSFSLTGGPSASATRSGQPAVFDAQGLGDPLVGRQAQGYYPFFFF